MSDNGDDTSGMTDEQLQLYRAVMDVLPDDMAHELRRLILGTLAANLKRYHVGAALAAGPS